MRKKLIPIIGLVMFLAVVGIARAITVSIEVKDAQGNDITGKPVPLNTVAYVSAHYGDASGRSASALLQVFFDDDPNSGPGWQYRATLFSGIVKDGDTISTTYTMTELGFYQFRWSAENTYDYGDVRTTVGPVIPEPGTLAALLMAMSAFGLLAVKKSRAKIAV